MHATLVLLGGLFAALTLAVSNASAGPTVVVPVTHEEFGRALDDLATHIQGLGETFLRHFNLREAGPEGPLVTIMLEHRAELGLTPAQVQELERIRSDFQKVVIKLTADQQVAEMDLAGLLRADPVDMRTVEAKIREIERLRGDLRLGRMRAIERGKAQLTAEQRAKLAILLGDPPAAGPRAGSVQFSHTSIR